MSGQRALGFVLPRFAIHQQGRAWTAEEVQERLRRLGACRLEVHSGRLFVDEFQRRMLLGMLLENVGLDAALELAGPGLWRQALSAKLLR
jgi:hypothetical protein